MLNYLARSTRPSILHPGSFKSFSSSTVGNMSKTSTPLFYHADPKDSWHGKIDDSDDSPFKAEKDRYHMYIGLFCPFAHRANIVRHLKGFQDIIDISITKPYPKGDENGWPGWQFPKDDHEYLDATVDKLFGSKYLHEIYFKADKDYKGRYSVPALWDKKTSTLVNNVSESVALHGKKLSSLNLRASRNLQSCYVTCRPHSIASSHPNSLRSHFIRSISAPR